MKLAKFLCLLVTCLFSLSGFAQETWVDFNETTFPDANFRARLIAYETTQKKAGKEARPIIDGGRIRVDLMTTFTTAGTKISDLTGIKYFFNLESLSTYSDDSTLKFLDVSGMTKLRDLKIASGGHGSNTYSNSGNKNNVLETLIIDGTAIEYIYAHRLGKLKHMSARNCANLLRVFADQCDLMGLDLTGCVAINRVVVDNNPNFTCLKIDPNATELSYVSAQSTKLNELKLPTEFTSTSTPDINVNYTKVSELNLTQYAGKQNAIVQMLGCPMKAVWAGQFGSGLTLQMPTTSTINVGCVDEFKICDPTQLKSKESVKTLSGCTYDNSKGTICFNSGETKAQYTFTTVKGSSSSQVSCTVTAIRQLKPLNLHIETTPTVHSYLDGTTSDHQSQMHSLTNIEGTNYYEVTLPLFYGNFQIVQTNDDGSRIQFGANSGQLTQKHKELTHGYTLVVPDGEYALHMEQTVTPTANADGVARSVQPHFHYTTHPDELGGHELGLYNSILTVEYINGAPAGTFSVTGGVLTGVEDIIVEDPVYTIDDSAQPVEYYDMYGRRISNPVAGQLVIRRQGNRVSKIISR